MDLIEAFVFCPRCGSRPATAGGSPFRCSECEFVYYFGPIVAVAGVVTDTQNRILLLRRARDPGRGKLGLPGGFVDEGETAETALLREIREETGLEASRLDYLGTHPNQYKYAGITRAVTDIFFHCPLESIGPITPQASEVQDWELTQVGAEQLDQMAFASNRWALEQYLTSLGK